MYEKYKPKITKPQSKIRILVIGAGFSGSVIARELAESGYTVDIIEKRNHIGGNAFDEHDEKGILVHRYGPHIFHTNSLRIWQYLNQYTSWNNYVHKVQVQTGGENYPFPINLKTINKIYQKNLTESQAIEFIKSLTEPISEIKTSEELIISTVGRKLYELFYLNYSIKQWGIHPSKLKSSVAARIPFRTNNEDRYFTDRFQGLPSDGYFKLFESILAHDQINIFLNTPFDQSYLSAGYSHIVFTGPIDQFFEYRFGQLGYRSIHFEHTHLPIERYQETGTVNFPNENLYTRITEFKHLTGQQHIGTSIVREFPSDDGEPYYPIPTEENENIFKKYSSLASNIENITFVGRLAEYRYYNMDQAIGSALSAAKKISAKLEKIN